MFHLEERNSADYDMTTNEHFEIKHRYPGANEYTNSDIGDVHSARTWSSSTEYISDGEYDDDLNSEHISGSYSRIEEQDADFLTTVTGKVDIKTPNNKRKYDYSTSQHYVLDKHNKQLDGTISGSPGDYIRSATLDNKRSTTTTSSSSFTNGTFEEKSPRREEIGQFATSRNSSIVNVLQENGTYFEDEAATEKEVSTTYTKTETLNSSTRDWKNSTTKNTSLRERKEEAAEIEILSTYHSSYTENGDYEFGTTLSPDGPTWDATYVLSANTTHSKTNIGNGSITPLHMGAVKEFTTYDFDVSGNSTSTINDSGELLTTYDSGLMLVAGGGTFTSSGNLAKTTTSTSKEIGNKVVITIGVFPMSSFTNSQTTNTFSQRFDSAGYNGDYLRDEDGIILTGTGNASQNITTFLQFRNAGVELNNDGRGGITNISYNYLHNSNSTNVITQNYDLQFTGAYQGHGNGYSSVAGDFDITQESHNNITTITIQTNSSSDINHKTKIQITNVPTYNSNLTTSNQEIITNSSNLNQTEHWNKTATEIRKTTTVNEEKNNYSYRNAWNTVDIQNLKHPKKHRNYKGEQEGIETRTSSGERRSIDPKLEITNLSTQEVRLTFSEEEKSTDVQTSKVTTKTNEKIQDNFVRGYRKTISDMPREFTESTNTVTNNSILAFGQNGANRTGSFTKDMKRDYSIKLKYSIDELNAPAPYAVTEEVMWVAWGYMMVEPPVPANAEFVATSKRSKSGNYEKVESNKYDDSGSYVHYGETVISLGDQPGSNGLNSYSETTNYSRSDIEDVTYDFIIGIAEVTSGAATGYYSKKNYTYFATGQTYAGEGAEEGTGNSIHKKHVETDGLLVIENGVKTKTGKINSTIRDNYKANYFILVSGTTTSVPAAGYSYSSNYHGVTAAGIKEGKNSKSTDAGYRQSGPINGAPTTNTRTSGTDNVSETSSYETTDMIGVGSENSVSPGSSSNTDYVSGGWHKYNHTYIGSTTVTSNGALSGSISNIEKMQWTSFDRLDVDSTNMYGWEISTKIANGNQTTSVIDQGSIHGYVNDPRSTTTYTKTVVGGISWHKTGTMSFYGIILPINDSGYTDLSQPAIGPLTKESHPSPSIVDWVQLGIDTIDMFDPTGALSALNAVVYFARGKVSEGIASSIGAIPLVGRGGKYLAKAMIKGGKVTDDAGKVYKAVLVGNAALTGVSLALSQDSIRAGATEVWHGIQDIGAGSMKKGIYEIWHGTFAITSGIRG
ncbi:MAG TPA: hypothetical protein PKD72_01350, partial [Gemmatales bacterium]|nr:hypothetical protein [Gemmatales bacterium]